MEFRNPSAGTSFSISVQHDLNTSSLVVTDGSNIDVIYTGDVYDGKWHHVLFSVDHVGRTLTSYVDGAYYDDIPMTVTSSTSVIGSSYNLKLAANGTTTTSFPGRLDQITLWNRALSSSEASDLYNSGKGLAYDN
jgi:hypothetical protein